MLSLQRDRLSRHRVQFFFQLWILIFTLQCLVRRLSFDVEEVGSAASPSSHINRQPRDHKIAQLQGDKCITSHTRLVNTSIIFEALRTGLNLRTQRRLALTNLN